MLKPDKRSLTVIDTHTFKAFKSKTEKKTKNLYRVILRSLVMRNGSRFIVGVYTKGY